MNVPQSPPPDLEAMLQHALAPIAADRRQRTVAYARYDADRALLVHRWVMQPDGEFRAAPIELEPRRLHPLLPDDAGAGRPMRPVPEPGSWPVEEMVGDIVREDAEAYVRAVTNEGEWLGVALVVEPRSLLRRRMDLLASRLAMLEMAVARQHLSGLLSRAQCEHRAALDSLGQRSGERIKALETEVVRLRADPGEGGPRHDALDAAMAQATELLVQAHVDLAQRSEQARRQTRLLYLIRMLLERHAAGSPPEALAREMVRCAAEAFSGKRCSLMLIHPMSEEGDGLRLAASLGLPASVDVRGVRVPMGEGVSGRAAEHREPVVVREESEAQSFSLVADDAYTSLAFISLPLICRGRVHGVLNLTNFRDGTFGDAEMQQLRTVALCIALVVDHAGLAERLFGGAREHEDVRTTG